MSAAIPIFFFSADRTDYASLSNPALRTYDYAYDVFGNLGQQDLNGGATRETYDYDAVQRLTEATRTGGASGTVDYAYDAIGNLTSKSDFSAIGWAECSNAQHPRDGADSPAAVADRALDQRQSISPRTTLHTRPPDQTSPSATVSSMIASWPTSRPWLTR